MCVFFKKKNKTKKATTQKQIFSFFPIVKVAAKYAKIDRVGNLDVGFQQVTLAQNFWNFHNIVIEHHLFKINEEKQKNIF